MTRSYAPTGKVIADEGTIIVLEAVGDSIDPRQVLPDTYWIAADRRAALTILEAIEVGEYVTCQAEPWQVINRFPAESPS